MTAGGILTECQNNTAKSSEVLILWWWDLPYQIKWSDPMNTAKKIIWRWSRPDLAMNKWSQEVIKQIADVIIPYWALRSILEIGDCQISMLEFTFQKFFAFSFCWRWWVFLLYWVFSSKQSLTQHYCHQLLSWQALLNTIISNGSLCCFHPRLGQKKTMAWNPT